MNFLALLALINLVTILQASSVTDRRTEKTAESDANLVSIDVRANNLQTDSSYFNEVMTKLKLICLIFEAKTNAENCSGPQQTNEFNLAKAAYDTAQEAQTRLKREMEERPERIEPLVKEYDSIVPILLELVDKYKC